MLSQTLFQVALRFGLACTCIAVGALSNAAPLAIQSEVQLRATAAALKQAGVPDALAGPAAKTVLEVGDTTECADVSAERYSAQANYVPGGPIGPFIKQAGFARGSFGAFAQGMQQTESFQDARAGKSRVITRIDAASKNVAATEGAKVHAEAPHEGLLIDLLGLQYAFAGRLQDIKAFSATLATGKGFSSASSAVLRENVNVAGQSIPAVRLYRMPADDGGLEIWYRMSDGVPLMTRLSLNAKYDATLTATSKTVPTAFKF